MTIHLPGYAAPAPEISSELARILADQAARDAAEVALHCLLYTSDAADE